MYEPPAFPSGKRKGWNVNFLKSRHVLFSIFGFAKHGFYTFSKSEGGAIYAYFLEITPVWTNHCHFSNSIPLNYVNYQISLVGLVTLPSSLHSSVLISSNYVIIILMQFQWFQLQWDYNYNKIIIWTVFPIKSVESIANSMAHARIPNFSLNR